MTATATITPGAYRLTGIHRTGGSCDVCTREIRQRVFAVAHRETGEEMNLGRRCAAKATGYAVTAVERQAAIAARLAEVARRRAIIGVEYPAIARAWAERDREYAARVAAGQDTSTFYGGHAAIVGDTAATEDAFWNGRGTRVYTDWSDYLAAVA